MFKKEKKAKESKKDYSSIDKHIDKLKAAIKRLEDKKND